MDDEMERLVRASLGWNTEEVRLAAFDAEGRVIAILPVESESTHGRQVSLTWDAFRKALSKARRLGARSVIVCHSHPLDDEAVPSPADIDTTRLVMRLARFRRPGIRDSMIFTPTDSCSIRCADVRRRKRRHI